MGRDRLVIFHGYDRRHKPTEEGKVVFGFWFKKTQYTVTMKGWWPKYKAAGKTLKDTSTDGFPKRL